MQVIELDSYYGNTPTWNDNGPHSCDESRGDGEVKLACGCMLPVVAGAISRDGQKKLKCICAGKTPCSIGHVNGHEVKVMRDTGSTTCVVKQSLVKSHQIYPLRKSTMVFPWKTYVVYMEGHGVPWEYHVNHGFPWKLPHVSI